jgi:hypothetical protein
MVQQADVDEGECLRQFHGDVAIRLARLAVSGWVVVAEDHGSGVESERALDDLAWVDGRPVDRPAKQRLVSDQPVASIEEQTAEDLVPEIGEPGAKAASRIAGLLKGAAPRPLALIAPVLAPRRCRPP